MERLAFWLLVTVAACAFVLGFAWLLQGRFIFFPFGDVPAPDDVGLPDVEAISFETRDGLRLNGWFVPSESGAPGPAVLVLNGNAGNRAYRAPLAAELRGLGVHVLLTDYRGFGGNPGTPSEEGLADDAEAARAYLLTRPEVDPQRIVYFGESLGTAVAVRLAVARPPAALILRSPFTSLVDVGRHHYRVLPVGLLLRHRFETLHRIRNVRVPVLVIGGQRDTIVPIDFTRQVYSAANDPKQLLVLDADHNDLELLAGPEMIAAIAQLLLRISPR
jgi:fermentation-respiration switch protein FrsA (DUF1100 family)